MSFDPGSIISLIQTCQTLYDYFNNVKQSSAERRRLLDEVLSLQSALEALQKLVKTLRISGDPTSTEQLAQLLDSSQPFHEALWKTLTDVETVLRNGVPKPGAKRWKILWGRLVAKLLWTADKAEVKALLADLERQKSRIIIALQHDMFKKQDDLEHHISNEDRLKIAKFISNSDYSGHRIDLLEKRLSGTGVWVLEHLRFIEWRDISESPRTLWCYGNPGAGKSVAAALIVDHLQSSGNIVLSMFCRYSLDAFTTPFPVLRGLLRQLIEKTTKVPPTICDRYWNGTHPSPDELPIFLAELAAYHMRPVYIVIDALDECSIGIELLRAIQRLDSSFRVLVTSRPVFREINEHPSIKIRASDDDILVAVDTTLSRLKHAWLDEELKSTVRVQVVDKADGMFLLASLQLRELERDVTCPRDVVVTLDSLPRTLDDAYKLTFQRIRNQGERKNRLACHALALLPSSDMLGPSHVEELLAEGDSTQYPDIEVVLQCCHGLIQRWDLGSTSVIIVFVHYSVHEYIIAHWSEIFPENPDRFKVCLELLYSVMTMMASDGHPMKGIMYWHDITNMVREPEELRQVVSLLSNPEVIAVFVQCNPDLPPDVDDPLLISCHFTYPAVMQHIIQTSPPDVERFNEALRCCRTYDLARLASLADFPPWADSGGPRRTEECIACINMRPEMRVNRDGVVVPIQARSIQTSNWTEWENSYDLTFSGGRARAEDEEIDVTFVGDDSECVHDFEVVGQDRGARLDQSHHAPVATTS